MCKTICGTPFAGGVTSGAGVEVGEGVGVWVCGSMGVDVQVGVRVGVTESISGAYGVGLPASAQAVSIRTVSSIFAAANSVFDKDESI